jgi:hypothetical protein
LTIKYIYIYIYIFGPSANYIGFLFYLLLIEKELPIGYSGLLVESSALQKPAPKEKKSSLLGKM